MLQLKSAEEVFKSIDTNFMTPVTLSYFEVGVYAIELSQGTGIHGESVFGITVLKRDSSTIRDVDTSAMSKLMSTRKEAESYISDLQRRLAPTEYGK